MIAIVAFTTAFLALALGIIHGYRAARGDRDVG